MDRHAPVRTCQAFISEPAFLPSVVHVAELGSVVLGCCVRLVHFEVSAEPTAVLLIYMTNL